MIGRDRQPVDYPDDALCPLHRRDYAERYGRDAADDAAAVGRERRKRLFVLLTSGHSQRSAAKALGVSRAMVRKEWPRAAEEQAGLSGLGTDVSDILVPSMEQFPPSVSVRLPTELLIALDAAAKEAGVSRSDYLRSVIVQSVAHHLEPVQ